MGIRFRKSIKLGKGVRLNLSKSGTSWTLGPRGASLNFGRRGAFSNLGVAGTGLYARERIDSSSSGRMPGVNRSGGTIKTQASASVSDDGTVTFHDMEGNPLTDYLVEQLKAQKKDEVVDLMTQTAEEINGHLEALETIHHSTPSPHEPPKFEERPFEDPEPIPPASKAYGFFGRLFKSHRNRIDRENAVAQENYHDNLEHWTSQKRKHFLAEQKRRREAEELVLTDTGTMEKVIRDSLEDLIWPRETDVSTEISDEGRVVMVDVDLPEIEDMPHRTASVPQRGYKLSIKELPKTKLQLMYVRHVHGVGFRIIGEIFYVLPMSEVVVLSAYTQRPDKATGVSQDDYIYSVRVTRQQWERIDFGHLDAVDPAEAFTRFELRRDLSKSGVFKAIEPFSGAST